MDPIKMMIAQRQGRPLPEDMEDDEASPYASIGRAQEDEAPGINKEMMQAQTEANFMGNFGNAISQAARGGAAPIANDDLYKNISAQASQNNQLAMRDMGRSAAVRKAIADRKARVAAAEGMQQEKAVANRRLDAQAAEAARHNRAMEGMAGQKVDKKNEPLRLPPDKVLNVNEGNVIPQQLSDVRKTLEANQDSFGPVMGRLNSLNPYDEKSSTIDAQMRAAAQSFGKYMEGGVLRKEDEDKYRKMFPSLSDTPEVARNKLAIVDRLLSSRQGSNVAALKTSGYDVSGVDQGLSVPDAPGILTLGKPGSSGLISEAHANSKASFSADDLDLFKEAKQRLARDPNDQAAKEALSILSGKGLK